MRRIIALTSIKSGIAIGLGQPLHQPCRKVIRDALYAVLACYTENRKPSSSANRRGGRKGDNSCRHNKRGDPGNSDRRGSRSMLKWPATCIRAWLCHADQLATLSRSSPSSFHPPARLRLFGIGRVFRYPCTHEREVLFGEIAGKAMQFNDCGQIVAAVWPDLPGRYPRVELDAFVIMPNHVHGIIVVGAIHESPLPESPLHDPRERRQMLLPKIIGYFKMNTAKRINELRHTPGIPVWQRNYYERVIRSDRELNTVRAYINNPRNWALDHDNPQSRR